MEASQQSAHDRRRFIGESENKLNVLQELTQGWTSIELDPNITCIDAAYYMYSLPINIESIRLTNCNIQLNRIFVKEMKGIKQIQLHDINHKRKKSLNENQMKCLTRLMPNLDSIKVNAVLLNTNEIVSWTQGFSGLRKFLCNAGLLHLFEHNNIGDQVLTCVSLCQQLVEFGIGGTPNQFNKLLTQKGFGKLVSLKKTLKVLMVRFVCESGNDLIHLLCKNLPELTSLEIKRNCYDSCLEIDESTLKELSVCKKLQSFSLIYFRDFGRNISINIAESMKNLRRLCLRACPIFQDIDVWSGLEHLEELDLSGDSWVRPNVLQGASRLPRLRIFYLGHFDHGETSCEQIVASYPPQGIFVQNIFMSDKNFPLLTDLHLEQCCTLTFWLDIRINRIRPSLKIHYRRREQYE